MFKIDTHQHFWRYNSAEYDWINDNMAAIRCDFGLAELLEHSAGQVSAFISVQARQSLEETRALLRYAEQNELIRGVVGWLPFTQPNVSDAIAELAANHNLRGLRHVLHDEPDPNYILREDFNRGVSAVGHFGLAYDILIFERHLPQTIQFVDRHPDQIFVLDHFGKPRVKANEVSPWRERIRDLAKRPNVYCKLSGLVTEAEYHNWTEEQLAPYFDVVLQAFGPQRLMFGSDWPVCLVAVSYSNWLRIVGSHVGKLTETEQQRIWSGTAKEAYQLQ